MQIPTTPSAYGFAEVVTIPERPDPPKREVVRLTRDQVIAKYFRGDAALFDAIYDKYHFPRSVGRQPRAPFAPMWHADQIETWREEFRADVKRLAVVLK